VPIVSSFSLLLCSMVLGKFIGWALVIAALAFTVAENSAQGIMDEHYFGIMSAYKVLHAHVPAELIQTRIFITQYSHLIIWDYIFKPMLWLPGWLTLGLLGIYILFKCRNQSSELNDGSENNNVSSYEDIVASAVEADEYLELDLKKLPSEYGEMGQFDPSKEADK